MKKFNLGDRVEVVKNMLSVNLLEGDTGTIIDFIDDDIVTVEFDEEFSTYHNGYNTKSLYGAKGKEHHCQWVPVSILEKIN